MADSFCTAIVASDCSLHPPVLDPRVATLGELLILFRMFYVRIVNGHCQLLLHDRHEEALEALRRYLGRGLTIDDEIVQTEYKSICGAIQVERQSKISITEVLLCRDRSSHLRRMLLGCGTQFSMCFNSLSARIC